MTEQEKQLLHQDLCARLPYGVICECLHSNTIKATAIDTEDLSVYYFDCDEWESIEHCKPYLRSLSSMTEEELAELSNIFNEWFNKELFYLTEEPFLEYALSNINYSISPRLFDWLNANHFDYRGLIKRGLAIEVTEDNNPYKS